MFNDYAVENENGKVIGWVMFERGEGYAWACADNEHEEWGYPTAEKAESALLEYCYS
jgi:hypothetical protein